MAQVVADDQRRLALEISTNLCKMNVYSLDRS